MTKQIFARYTGSNNVATNFFAAIEFFNAQLEEAGMVIVSDLQIQTVLVNTSAYNWLTTVSALVEPKADNVQPIPGD